MRNPARFNPGVEVAVERAAFLLLALIEDCIERRLSLVDFLLKSSPLLLNLCNFPLHELGFVVESLYTLMLRINAKDPTP